MQDEQMSWRLRLLYCLIGVLAGVVTLGWINPRIPGGPSDALGVLAWLCIALGILAALLVFADRLLSRGGR